MQVEEFNCCNHYSDHYTVAIVVDEESVGHVPRDVLKLENYDEIRLCLYKLSIDKLMNADNSFPGKNIYLDKVRVPNFWEICAIYITYNIHVG